MTTPRQSAWRVYAAAAITGVAGNTTHGEIPELCHVASEIADEMVRREGERFDDDDE